MIQVQGLSRRFGETLALRDVSFDVAAGEIVGFLGPNGAGKSTAMKILTCTLAPTAGTATVDGHDVLTEPLAVRRRTGFMPENAPLPPDVDVHELLRFVATLKGVAGDRIEGELRRIEEQAGIGEVRSRLVGRLSKGYRQRVGLAQALVGDPPVLVLDEPTAGLDPHQIVEIRNLIRDFRGRKTVLLSSHILNEVSLICERVLILDRGRLVAEEHPATLAREHQMRHQVALEWKGPREAVMQALAGVDGVQEVRPTPTGAEVVLSREPEDVNPALAAAVQAAGGGLLGLRTAMPSLEDLFLRLTGREEDGRGREQS
jgi:ABC-2 type transport system ATP-binding protein